jgi:hypothetical protein
LPGTLWAPCWHHGHDYRNNTSDYYVNNKKVNVKEVTTLLKDKGIDLDNNRFLILQVSITSSTHMVQNGMQQQQQQQAAKSHSPCKAQFGRRRAAVAVAAAAHVHWHHGIKACASS